MTAPYDATARERGIQVVRRWRELAEADGHDWRRLVAEDRALPYIEAAQLDLAMREQLATEPEAGGPRDPAIGPHPRFREMDARRELRLRGQPIPPELADTDPQRSPRGWQGGDA